jgi:hypothetical protein
VLAGGKELPMQGYIQAVAPGVQPAPIVGPPTGGPVALQGPAQQATNLPGPGANPAGLSGNPGSPNNPPGSQQPLDQPTLLGPDAHGVVGIRHLELGNDSILTTSDKDLKLDSGTQLLIRSEAKPSSPSQ